MPHDLNDSAPTSLSHIIGQQGVTNQLRVALDAAFEDHRRLDDALLVGPPGLGKTQIAAVLGHELAVKTHEALGQSIKNASDLNALLLGARDKEIIFIDEVHELPKIFQTSLYLALDKRKIVVKGGRSFQFIPLAEFTLLLGTTDEYLLLQPLRDRMRLLLLFEFYTDEDSGENRDPPSQVVGVAHGRPVATPDRPACEGHSTSRPAAPASLPSCLPSGGSRGHHPQPPPHGVRTGASGRAGTGIGRAALPPCDLRGGDKIERHRQPAGIACEDAELRHRTLPDPSGDDL